jgi:hypothetical protein
MPEREVCPVDHLAIATFSSTSALGIGVATHGETGIDSGPSRRESDWAGQRHERSRGATP